MTLVESLQKAIEYMENHLLEDISIKEIAEEAHLSPYHFQRTFTILTDISVGEYIRRRRLTKAAYELLNSKAKIIDIAYKYGYQTPESFAKAFHKQHGLTPSEVRKGTGKIQSYNRLMIQVNLKGAEPMKYQILDRKSFQIVGVKEKFDCEDNNQSIEINRLWSQIAQDGTLNRLLELNNGEISGLIGATIDYSKVDEKIEYWIGTEYEGEIQEGLLSHKVPAARWVIFEAVGPVIEAVPEAWRKIYSEWFPSNDFEHAGGPSLEVYKSADPTSATAKTEIWVPIK